jgi:hypothetical protein
VERYHDPQPKRKKPPTFLLGVSKKVPEKTHKGEAMSQLLLHHYRK